MSTEIPKTMRAVVQNDDETISVRDNHPVPTIGPNEVLVKVHYAAQNPTDWKQSRDYAPPDSIIGCDFSGTVAALGQNCTNADLKVGDKVAGFVHGMRKPDVGAYAEYVKQNSDLLFKVPEGMDMAQASTYGVAYGTACQVLVQQQKADWPPVSQNGKYYLVYGGSTSVGLFATSLAKALGYTTIVVCSPHSFDLVKSYGADHTVDYHQGVEAAGAEIRQIADGKGVTIALDAVTQGDSMRFVQAGFADEGGVCNLLWPKSTDKYRKDIKWAATGVFVLLGKGEKMTPRYPKDPTHEWPTSASERQFGVDMMQRAPELFIKYGVKGNPVDIRGGLDAVQDGFEYMKAGKVSGKKLVYKVAN